MRTGTSILQPEVVAALGDLDPSAIKLAVILGKYADTNGQCFPGTRRLMAESGIADWRTFNKARNTLRGYGLRWQRGSGRQTCVYKWNPVASVMATDTTEPVASVMIPDTTAKKKTRSACNGSSRSACNGYRRNSPLTPHNTQTQKVCFEKARKLYPSTKRGLDTEFANFTKKHKDWREVLPLLLPAIENQIKCSRPDKWWKHFQTWINQRCWEEEINNNPQEQAATNDGAVLDAQIAQTEQEYRERQAAQEKATKSGIKA